MPPKPKIDPTLLDEFQSKFAETLIEFTDKILEIIQRNPEMTANAVRDLVVLEIRKRFMTGDEPE